jgi:oligopeptide/dipeptide ABC transporter ATP-binding protein
MSGALLEVDNLSIVFHGETGAVQAVRKASLVARPGEVIGIMGESGSGKSTLVAAMIGLLPGNAAITSGSVHTRGIDLYRSSEATRRSLRGQHIAMVFQDPMNAFNPVFSIGEQLVDLQHQDSAASGAAKSRRVAEMLAKVGIADPLACMQRYPHELSGGMRQRVAIAAALMLRPSILLADEPTTALDVTMEAQIIHLLRELRSEIDGAIIIVTHQLGVIAELCDRVHVMYAGEIVEEGPVDTIFHAPRHPYTQGLLACDPGRLVPGTRPLPTIAGQVPSLVHPPQGCSFAARCPKALPRCQEMPPPWVALAPDHAALCHEVSP